MTCCCAAACAGHFDSKRVTQDLRAYRANGPAPTTRALCDALLRTGVQQSTLLDIGGGVGAIQHALLAAGAREATLVEASSAYLDAARAEAEQRGWEGRIRYQLGDFVEVAAQIPAADIVTLDRVVCCYPGMEALVRLSAARSNRLYGLVYPRGEWWVRAVIWFENIIRMLTGNPFRSFVHSPKAMDGLIRSLGFALQSSVRTFMWEVVVYAR
jgi:magnesium-protoporphyrin O-methyltransferase